jgi:cytochrome oxidase assembly protein ShyY1
VPGPVVLRQHRQVVGLVVTAVVVALCCVALGRWQWHRYQSKHARNALVQGNYDRSVVDLRSVLPRPADPADPADPAGARLGTGLGPRQEWRPVRVSGRYDVSGTTLIRNRPREVSGTDPTFGFEIVLPLRLDDGTVLLVDRGWVPNSFTGERAGRTPDAVPAPPSGKVSVVVTLRRSEPSRDQQLPAGQAASIAVPQIARALGVETYPAYGALRSESPAVSPAPLLPQRPQPDGGEGINASYAVQWLLFAALALGFPFWFVRRTRRPPPDSAGDRADVQAAGTATGRPRRRRIWDDEDE